MLETILKSLLNDIQLLIEVYYFKTPVTLMESL